MNDIAYTHAYTQQTAPCIICQQALEVRPTKGRKSGKPSIMVICPNDGRHFRGFINDQNYVRQVLDQMESTVENDAEEEA